MFLGGALPYNNPLLLPQGKYAEAEPLYERSQAILEKALGPEHPAVAVELNNRAGLLESQVRAVINFQGSCCGVQWVFALPLGVVVGVKLWPSEFPGNSLVDRGSEREF